MGLNIFPPTLVGSSCQDAKRVTAEATDQILNVNPDDVPVQEHGYVLLLTSVDAIPGGKRTRI
jgi:hypothetical protein